MDQHLTLLTRLEAAVRHGVEATHRLNRIHGQQNYIAQMEARGQMDAAWADILLALEELDAFSPPSVEGGETKEQL